MKASYKTTSLDVLNDMLHKGIVEFEFIKKDGSVRSAKGTLDPAHLPPAKPVDGEAVPRKKNDSVFVYYDMEKNSFRSFVKTSFLGAY